MATKYSFSKDFNVGAGALTNLKSIVEKYGIPSTYIEIGVYEGSTFFWLAEQIVPLNKDFKMYAIDPHDDKSVDLKSDFSEVKQRFTDNLSACEHKKNIEYINEYSNKALVKLINDGVKAQVIYVDGDHTAGGVLTDLVLSWELLVPGGVMLCDDSVFWKFIEDDGHCSPHRSPRLAVENFMFCNWDRIKTIMLPDNSQTGFIKLC